MGRLIFESCALSTWSGIPSVGSGGFRRAKGSTKLRNDNNGMARLLCLQPKTQKLALNQSGLHAKLGASFQGLTNVLAY